MYGTWFTIPFRPQTMNQYMTSSWPGTLQMYIAKVASKIPIIYPSQWHLEEAKNKWTPPELGTVY